MSKKLFIPSTNLRNELGNIFKSFISRVGYHEDAYCYNLFYGLMGGCTSFDDIDDYPYEDYEAYEEWKRSSSKHGKGSENIYDLSKFWDEEEDRKKGKRGKHGKHSKKNNARLIDINTPYSGEEDLMNDEWTYDDGRVIYFYPDYHDRESKLEFNDYDEFKEYCESMAYKIPSMVDNWIRYNTVCHCCLSTEALKEDKYEIVAEESYGVLFYDVCDIDEL